MQPCDDTFLTTAPLLNRFSIDLPVTSATAWSECTRPGALSWCTLITGSRYLTPPQGIDTVRELSMRPSAIKAREHYFRWEEEPNIRYRNTFYAAAFTVPGLQRFAEDMLVEEIATGCRLTWTFAIEPKPPAPRAAHAWLHHHHERLAPDRERYKDLLRPTVGELPPLRLRTRATSCARRKGPEDAGCCTDRPPGIDHSS